MMNKNAYLCLPPTLPLHPHVAAGQGISITLTAQVMGGGRSSASAFIDANPPPHPTPPSTLDTILILRLEDGADTFISLRGTYLPSCYGMDLDRLLTLGDSPVVAVEQLDAEGQALLQQGLQPQPLLASAAAAASGVAPDLPHGLQQQVAGLGLAGLEGPTAAAAGAAAEDAVTDSNQVAAHHKQPSLTGADSHIPKEVQRLVHFLQVGWSGQLADTLLQPISD